MQALHLAVLGLGVAMVVRALASGGGPLALGVVVGAAFVILGAGRAWMGARR